MFKKPIKLPVYYHTESTLALELEGKHAPLDDMEIRNVDFYSIGAVSIYIEDKDEVGSRIYSGGDMFLSPLKQSEVEKEINKQLKIK